MKAVQPLLLAQQGSSSSWSASLMQRVKLQREQQSHFCSLSLGNVRFGHHSCTEQAVRRGMVFSQAILHVGPSITFHEIKYVLQGELSSLSVSQPLLFSFQIQE